MFSKLENIWLEYSCMIKVLSDENGKKKKLNEKSV